MGMCFKILQNETQQPMKRLKRDGQLAIPLGDHIFPVIARVQVTK